MPALALAQPPGLAPKGPLIDAASDRLSLVDLLAGKTAPMLVPDSICYEVYARNFRRRVEASPPPALTLVGSTERRVVKEGFVLGNPLEFRTYQQIRRELITELSHFEGYRFSWGFLIEQRCIEATVWELVPGEILRHFQHDGLSIDELSGAFDSWAEQRRIPAGVRYMPPGLGMALMLADGEVSPIAMRHWLARSFIPDQLSLFLERASEIAAEAARAPRRQVLGMPAA